MEAYILDTSVLSAHLDAGHRHHDYIRECVRQVERRATVFLSAISLAELGFGVNLAESFGHNRLPALKETIAEARQYRVLDVSHHTAAAYADLKAALARKYLANASAQGRPRWIEDWVDKTTGKKLQIDENDLWMCAQAKERNFVVCTADRRMARISDADSEVRLDIL